MIALIARPSLSVGSIHVRGGTPRRKFTPQGVRTHAAESALADFERRAVTFGRVISDDAMKRGIPTLGFARQFGWLQGKRRIVGSGGGVPAGLPVRQRLKRRRRDVIVNSRGALAVLSEELEVG
jgi:hypothetical protein